MAKENNEIGKKNEVVNANIYLGIQLEIAGHPININPTTPINKISEYGLEGELEEPLRLGTVATMFNTVTEEFGIKKENNSYTWNDIQKEIQNTGIPVLGNLTKTIGDAALSIEKLSIKYPPTKIKVNGILKDISEENRRSTQYTLGLSATWEEGQGKLFGGVAVRGIYLKASSESQTESFKMEGGESTKEKRD
jgi:hypothetical protein